LALYKDKSVYLPGRPDVICEIARNWDGKRIFLQDGDALVYPLEKLVPALEYISEKLPYVERIAAYATCQDILRIVPEDLRRLKELKLAILYIGLESGDDEILQKIGKGVDSRQMVQAAVRVKAAGIKTSVTVILGLGGTGGSERHVIETSAVLNRMDPDFAGALTLIMVPGTPFYQAWKSGSFVPISAFQSLRELLALIKYSDFSNCLFSSMHASNYFAVRGTLPQDKTNMTRKLEEMIRRQDPSSLRPEFLRGL